MVRKFKVLLHGQKLKLVITTRDPGIVQSFKSKCKITVVPVQMVQGTLNYCELVNHWRIIVFNDILNVLLS